MFEIAHDKSVNVYPHMYNGNVQQNPLCVGSCATKEFSISPRFSPTIFDPDASSVLYTTPLYSSRLYAQKTLCSKLFPMQIQCSRAHLCTALDSIRRKPCVQNCSRERESLYNGNAQQNHLCAASCVTKDSPISPRFSPTFFYRDANSVLLLAHLCTAVVIGPMRRTLYSKLFMMRA